MPLQAISVAVEIDERPDWQGINASAKARLATAKADQQLQPA